MKLRAYYNCETKLTNVFIFSHVILEITEKLEIREYSRL